MDKPSQSPAAHTREPFIYHTAPSDQNLARQAPGEIRERKREEAVLIGWSEPPQIGTVPARELLKKQAQDVIFKNKRHQALMEHII